MLLLVLALLLAGVFSAACWCFAMLLLAMLL
jgi:hypothetical protein